MAISNLTPGRKHRKTISDRLDAPKGSLEMTRVFVQNLKLQRGRLFFIMSTRKLDDSQQF
jgi:hypothetical protein